MRMLRRSSMVVCAIAMALFLPAGNSYALDCTAVLRDGKEVKTYISAGTSELLYKLEIEQATQISLRSSFSFGVSRDFAHFQIEDTNGSVYDLGDIHQGSWALDVSTICLPEGIYYIRVNFEPLSGNYDWLFIQYDEDLDGRGYDGVYEFEDNNEPSDATQMGESSMAYGAIYNYQESSRGMGYADVDYYLFELTERSNVTLNAQLLPKTEIALTDLSGNVVRVDGKKDSALCAVTPQGPEGLFVDQELNCGLLPAGKYCIRVSGKHTSTEAASYIVGYFLAPSKFTDVVGLTPHREHINWLASSGISQGFPNGTFRPYAEVARCDMAAFLYRLAGSPAFEPAEEDWRSFKDVTAETPHAHEVLWLASTGVSKGYPDGTFRPYATVTRCDMAAFLHRMAGDMSAEGRTSFLDVSASTPHAADIAWLAESGVSTGFPDGTFHPYSTVVRCDMAAFLHRMEGKVAL